jgi:ribosomal protein S18 acetylase RimI-like enzyme
MATTTDRDAVIAWHARRHALIADSIEPWGHGALVRASAYPSYYDYNLVRVEDAATGCSAADLAAVAERHHGDLGHRRVRVNDEAAGERLRPEFAALGWRCRAIESLVLAGDPPPADGAVRVRRAPDAEARPLREEWYREEPWMTTEDQTRAFLDAEEEVHAKLGGDVLLVDGEGPGGLGAYVGVLRAGDTGEIGEAYATPALRGRGIGGALVAAAARDLAASGVRTIIIEADTEGRARRLYRRLGFAHVWTFHDFTRLPGR